MDTLGWILLYCTAAGVLGVLTAATFLLLPPRWREWALPHLVAFAVGALLGTALLALLPRAAESPQLDVHGVGAWLLAGLVLFFVAEKLLLGYPRSGGEPGGHATGPLILVGDGLHNFVDGIVVGAATLHDPALGAVTAVAVVLHELPQEVGDFAVLLHGGYGRGQALWLNILSGLTAVGGGLVAWFGLTPAWVPPILALAAASFLYIALVGLVPVLKRRTGPRATLLQLVWGGAGVLLVAGAHSHLAH